MNARSLVSALVLQRDVNDAGVVSLSPGDRQPVVDYVLDPRDAHSMAEALVTAGRVLAAAGASKIWSFHLHDPPTAVLDGHTDDQKAKLVDAWAAKVRARGFASDNRSTLLSAHQMGTCRLGTSPNTSVVDLDGQSWECPGLYVCDASLFPTASGVNPMLTTMALAKIVAERLARNLDQPRPDADARAKARWTTFRRRTNLRQAVEIATVVLFGVAAARYLATRAS